MAVDQEKGGGVLDLFTRYKLDPGAVPLWPLDIVAPASTPQRACKIGADFEVCDVIGDDCIMVPMPFADPLGQDDGEFLQASGRKLLIAAARRQSEGIEPGSAIGRLDYQAMRKAVVRPGGRAPDLVMLASPKSAFKFSAMVAMMADGVRFQSVAFTPIVDEIRWDVACILINRADNALVRCFDERSSGLAVLDDRCLAMTYYGA